MTTDLKKRAFALAGIASALAFTGLLDGCSTTPVAVAPGAGPITAAPVPPPAPREFRAAWVSTVANIDWPSKPTLNSAQQQAEAIAILDRAQAMHLNAIVLQVRPSADAIYPSRIEPWSEYLTGKEGQAPQPFYDPLAFWIAQAHARGLELHAWFNPYRARNTSAKSANAADHISRTKPETVKAYGKFLWMDPGEDGASQQTLAVVLDVVRRYDVDGIHIDDYFYPYPIEAPGVASELAALEAGGAPKAELDFPDQPSWQRYLLGGGTLARADWRRENVNKLIEALYTGIHREKSWVRFGVSPFGIGKPALRPPGITGFSQYDKLYADAEKWLQNGWVDYLSPQLYWPIAQAPQAYDVLLDYWIAQNSKGRHIWPGMFTSRIDASAKAWPPEEIVAQIGIARARAGAGGHVHFSMAALMENRKGISDQLKAGPYASPALVPATPWLAGAPPGVPSISKRRVNGGLSLHMVAGKNTSEYAIWSRYGNEWRFAVAQAASGEWRVADDAVLGAANAVVISPVDRLGNEGARVTLALTPAQAQASASASAQASPSAQAVLK